MCAKVNTTLIGRKGELLCAKYLAKIGCTVITQNWYCRWGEIDIIAKSSKELIFVEVKTVTSTTYCNPIELFNPAKRRKLLRTINYFNYGQNTRHILWRLDLICITYEKNRIWIEHYKNVLAL